MGEPVKPTMIKWLVKFGIVKDELYAGYILIGITILCFLISAIASEFKGTGIAFFVLD